MRKAYACATLVLVACGGGERDESAPPAAAPTIRDAVPQAAAAPPGRATGVVHDVQMVLTPDGRYLYQPATLTINAGDAVRWTNVSGGPHNVAFYPDRIPVGASDVLAAAISETMPRSGPLSGMLLMAENATFAMTFTGAPTGTYEYFCTPHELLGMVATLTIAE